MMHYCVKSVVVHRHDNWKPSYVAPPGRQITVCYTGDFVLLVEPNSSAHVWPLAEVDWLECISEDRALAWTTEQPTEEGYYWAAWYVWPEGDELSWHIDMVQALKASDGEITLLRIGSEHRVGPHVYTSFMGPLAEPGAPPLPEVL